MANDDLTQGELSTLELVCEAILPSLVYTAGDRDPVGTAEFYERGARERGIGRQVAAAVPGLPYRARRAVVTFLDEARGLGLDAQSGKDSLASLIELGDRSPLHRIAFAVIRASTLGAFVGHVPAGERSNPVWGVVGYPAPAAPSYSADQAPGRLDVHVVPDTVTDIEADVCVIGSGAGGAVIAARAAQAGRSVVVLEAGRYRSEADFDQIDEHAADMFLRNGSLWSDSGQLGVLAGSVLGGGTLINSMVCLRTPDHIRRQWADQGLVGLDTCEFDKNLDAVWQALNVNTEATTYNSNTRAMITGLAGLGYRHERLPRNASFADDPSRCGLCNSGCALGCKRSALHTYLQTAVDHCARVVVECVADTITTADGRTTGVRARLVGGAEERPLTVHAPTVVVAAGGVESAALLLRSGIGGPAVGKNLRVHPAWIVTGVYDQPIEAWSGQIQSAVSFDLTNCEDANGFLVETLTLNPLTWAGQTPFADARAHRDLLRRLPYFGTWHGVAHDHGAGEIYLDEDGHAAVRWSLDDDVDQRVALRAHIELARMHREAGANEIFTFHQLDQRWRRGEDFDAYLDRLRQVPFSRYTAFSAHQMGACRLGADPRTSVADCTGQLHDVLGAWIGDGSALPSAPGVNPMISIMALAERTAANLLVGQG